MVAAFSQILKFFFFFFFFILIISNFIGQIDCGPLEKLEQMKKEKMQNFANIQNCEESNLKNLKKELNQLNDKRSEFLKLYLNDPTKLKTLYDKLIKKKQEEEQKKKLREEKNKNKRFKLHFSWLPKRKEYDFVIKLYEDGLATLVYVAKLCKNIVKNFPKDKNNEATNICGTCQSKAIELLGGRGIDEFEKQDETRVLYQALEFDEHRKLTKKKETNKMLAGQNGQERSGKNGGAVAKNLVPAVGEGGQQKVRKEKVGRRVQFTLPGDSQENLADENKVEMAQRKK